MIGPLEKGIEQAKFATPAQGSYDGIDLSVLPKYICFKAALLQGKLTQQYLILILATVFIAYYTITRIEVHSLYGKLRTKEFILAPGVQDFTPAMPQNVPDSYVSNAVTDFLNQLGNITPGGIDEQYASLAEAMSPQLKVRFLAEASNWKAKVKAEGISELLSVTPTDKEIRTRGDGLYDVTALARKDTYINNEYVGHTDEVVEMTLELIPPKTGKRWYLQINSLSRESADTFRSKRNYKTGSGS